MCSKQVQRRKRIYEFYLANRSQGKRFMLDHFKVENVPKRTIYDIIQRAENDSEHQRVYGSGRVAKKMTKTNIKHLKTMFDHQDGVSVRQAARKFNYHYTLISKTFRTHTSIRVYKKKKIPMRT